MSRPTSVDLSVPVDAMPEPGLLRPAIEAALAGRAWVPGPEASVAEAVRAAVAAALTPPVHPGWYAGSPDSPHTAGTPAGQAIPAAGGDGS